MLIILLWLLSSMTNIYVSNGTEADIRCLRSIKDSLQDPLSLWKDSWNFDNMTEGFICKFTGVECWHPDEDRVLNIQLSDMGVTGFFPQGIVHCTSLSGLDLLSNHLSGPIPSNISKLLPHVTKLDLSSNEFSGEIPPDIANCIYLSDLRLDNNRLTGPIPPGLAQLDRIKFFSLSNNNLQGPVPEFRNASNILAESFANNPGLCGFPSLKRCHHSSSKETKYRDRDLFISGFVVGFALFKVLVMLLVFFCFPTLSIKNDIIVYLAKYKKRKRKERKQAAQRRILQRSRHTICAAPKEILIDDYKILALEKWMSTMSFTELKKATNDFDRSNLIGVGRMGIMYEAALQNGWSLAIKRLHDWHNVDQFVTEVLILGRIRHRNIVSLLGFSLALTDTLLAYKYMSNGNLYNWLHSRPRRDPEAMGWPLRLKIAVGIARGIAWLHHNAIFRVAHLNILSKCILLDKNFEPKLSNFEGAKFVNVVSNGGTSSNQRSLFSMGSGRVPNPGSYKEDVYSFGVVLVELITGKEVGKLLVNPPLKITRSELESDSKIGEWISTHLLGGSLSCIGFDDYLIGRGYDKEEMFEVLRIARNCVRHCADDRPTMLEVYAALQAIVEDFVVHEFETGIHASNDLSSLM